LVSSVKISGNAPGLGTISAWSNSNMVRRNSLACYESGNNQSRLLCSNLPDFVEFLEIIQRQTPHITAPDDGYFGRAGNNNAESHSAARGADRWKDSASADARNARKIHAGGLGTSRL
jgi:hypothetical protein